MPLTSLFTRRLGDLGNWRLGTGAPLCH